MGNDRQGVNSFNPPPGMIRTGTIVGYDPGTNMMQVQLTEARASSGKILPIPVPAHFPHADSNGLFMGSLPAKGTTVTLGQSTGGQYYTINHQPENLGKLPDLTMGELLHYTTESSFISLDLDSHIYMGSDTSNIHIFAGSQQQPKTNLITINFENENHFNQAYREVGGLVKRDIRPVPAGASYTGNTKLEDDLYYNLVPIIGMDPQSTANDLPAGPTKNPPFVEHRQLVYEFQYQSDIDDDITESNKYSSTSQSATIYTTQDRRASRYDTMSLSLVSPNFLMEEIKGTVIDVFANVLDINRVAIPVGLSATNTFRTNGTIATTNAQQSYINIRALERKSIAYHFELNARKDPALNLSGIDLSINGDNYNAKLQRSRFSFDVDKEGHFKLNVPASSETGNIPLLTRAENYSTFAATDSGNPNQTWFTPSPNNVAQDIYLDSFAAPKTTPSSSASGFDIQAPHGSIQLIDGSTNADQGPIDRIAQFVNNNTINIKHGTVYHDILQVCSTQKAPLTLSYPTSGVENVSVDYIANDPPTNAANVTSKITVSGAGANAGGRSGLLNFDGSLEVNIGANSIDRQSLWLDTAGGIVSSIGRDNQGRSLLLGMDGYAFIQIGGYGIAQPDARFKNHDGLVDGILDLRIFNGGFVHIVRIDSKGIVIMSPGRIGIHAGQGLTLSSDADILISSESLTLNVGGYDRLVEPINASV